MGRSKTGSDTLMSAADLREAFNSVAEPRFTASQAFLSYERAENVESQRLIFKGIGADGNGFTVQSDALPAGTDVNAAARATATALLEKGTPA
jgi:hypothetical protein